MLVLLFLIFVIIIIIIIISSSNCSNSSRFDSHDFSIECESLLAAGPLPVPGDIGHFYRGCHKSIQKV